MIVFDLDDTLYLERDFAFSGYRHLDALVREMTGMSGFGHLCRDLYLSGERRKIFNRACAALGLNDTPDFIAQLVEAYRAHPPAIVLCPDSSAFFARRPGRYGLITDGPARMQHNKIAALGLVPLIAHRRATGDWPDGQGKPHPRAFEEMEALAPEGAPMVYVADNPAKDFVTPNLRGWTSVQITRAGAVHDPTPKDDAHKAAITLTTLDDLEAALPARCLA